MIIGGDYNCVIDPVKDAQPRRTVKSKSATILQTYLKNCNMVDAWRCLNPTAQEYSFYSAVHKSYSRINLFVVDAKMLQNVRSIQYHNRLISDHGLLTLDLKLKTDKGVYNCRFDNSLLMDNGFCNYINEKIGLFISENDNGSVNDSVLWDALRLCIMGCTESCD